MILTVVVVVSVHVCVFICYSGHAEGQRTGYLSSSTMGPGIVPSLSGLCSGCFPLLSHGGAGDFKNNILNHSDSLGA